MPKQPVTTKQRKANGVTEKAYVQPLAAQKLQSLGSRLSFTQETILQDAADQPSLFLSAVEYRVECLRTSMRARMNLDAAEAEAGFRAREALAQLDEKITEKRVEELVRKDPERTEALEGKLEADAQEEASKLLVEAYRHRRDCLKLVGEMVSSEVSLQSAVETGRGRLDQVRRKARERYQDA